MGRSVSAIAVTPIKGFALEFPEQVVLGPHGVDENRRFALVDSGGFRLRSTKHAWPCTLSAQYEAETNRLTIRFPDGPTIGGDVVPDGDVEFDYHSKLVAGRVVDGPWTAALSALAGTEVRLVKLNEAGRVQGEPVTFVSTASLERIQREAGRDLDPRRFRMLFHVEGCKPHEEDTWLGRRVRIGEAVVRVNELVERCVVTTRDPATGERDFDTLALLTQYRGSIDFGVRARVEQPGPVHVGDLVEPL